MSMGFFIMIIGQVQLDGVHGLVEGPGELVFPERLYHHVLHILQLVGLAAGLGGVGGLRRGSGSLGPGRQDPRGGGRHHGGHPPAARSLAVTAAARGGLGFLCAPRRGPASHVWAQLGSTWPRLPAPLWLPGPGSIIDVPELTAGRFFTTSTMGSPLSSVPE